MEKINFNKEFKIFWTILIISILFFSYILFTLLQSKAKAEEILEKNKSTIEKVEKIKVLSEKWRAFENEIVEKRKIIENEQSQLTLLEKEKYEIEEQIHSIRAEFFWKKQ